MSESILEMEEGLSRGYERRMEDFLRMAASTFTSWSVITALATAWHLYVESEVLKPYLVCHSLFFKITQVSSLLNLGARMSSSTFSKPNYTCKAISPHGIPRSPLHLACEFPFSDTSPSLIGSKVWRLPVLSGNPVPCRHQKIRPRCRPQTNESLGRCLASCIPTVNFEEEC